MNPPTSPLVAVAWLNALPELPAPAATSRPSTTTSWAATGFVVVSVVGGATRDTNLRTPVLSLDAWTVAPGSSKPPRGQAANLLEVVWDACYDATAAGIIVQPGTGYAPALVQSVWPETEPREIQDPDSSYAHFSMDIGLAWVRAD